MRIYIKHQADADYRFDFGFSDDLEKNEAMLKFVSSCVYDALFDFETGIWKESPIYVLELYKRYGAAKTKLD